MALEWNVIDLIFSVPCGTALYQNRLYTMLNNCIYASSLYRSHGRLAFVFHATARQLLVDCANRKAAAADTAPDLSSRSESGVHELDVRDWLMIGFTGGR